jgi:hypothetical protein
MNVTDELLMAYADGELDAATRAQVEHEIANNPSLAKQVERHRELRARLQNTFDPILSESVPERLKASLSASPEKTVIDLTQVRTKIAEKRLQPISFNRPLNWLSLAASVIVGILIGVLAFNRSDEFALQGERLVAKGTLARSLGEALAGNSTGSAVRIGLSYEAQSGDFCRTFVMPARNLAGLACHAQHEPADAWRIRMLVPTEGTINENYRTAASNLPPSLLDQVNREIKGEPFDADQEKQIIARKWVK